MNIASSKEMGEVIQGMIEVLGLPDEAYTELNVFMNLDQAVMVEAKFYAKGKEAKGDAEKIITVTKPLGDDLCGYARSQINLSTTIKEG